jgi:hypothetical protein
VRPAPGWVSFHGENFLAEPSAAAIMRPGRAGVSGAVGVAVGLLLVKALGFKQCHPLGLRRLQPLPLLTRKGCLAGLADV